MESDQINIALSKLTEFKQNKIRLKYPVFFVPGWTDESCSWWQKPYGDKQSIKQWIDEIAVNPELAQYITFIEETKQCKNFLDFGEVLKNKIWKLIGKNQAFDLVGHSMGGLDIRAALTQENEPLLNCRYCITVATPNCGDNFGGVESFLSRHFRKLMQSVKNMPSYQVDQGKYLDPDYPPIKQVNSLDNRRLFLNNVNKFYELKGTQDFLVQGSAFIDKTGIEGLFSEKVAAIPIDGCEHVGIKGITLDPRTIAVIIYVLCDIDLKLQLGMNYGILQGGYYKPDDEKDKFV